MPKLIAEMSVNELGNLLFNRGMANDLKQEELMEIGRVLREFRVVVVHYNTDDDNGVFIKATLGFHGTIFSSHIHEVLDNELDVHYGFEWPGVGVMDKDALQAYEESLVEEIESQIAEYKESENDNE